jgi:uncharacterized protein (DUF488 family)
VTKVPIYTIGYGNRSITDFIGLLHKYKIDFLIDIRSRPYSRYNPDFSKEPLERRLKQAGIRYVFMGDTLGGRPDDSTCYVDDKVDYTKVREKSFFQNGIERIHTAWEKQLYVALMCSETKPHECHRSKLVGQTLIQQNIDVAHIDESGMIKNQDEVIRNLIGRQPSLFDEQNEKVGFSRKKYIVPNERV